jgi:Undecaprenyl-phosphate galactose phosphotransferase WbaP
MFSLYPGIAMAPADELRNFTVGSLLSFGGIIVSRYIEDNELDAISAAFFISFASSIFILLLCRSIMRGILSMTRFGGIPAVIYGGGEMGTRLINKLLDNRWLGYVPVLILDDDSSIEPYRGVPVIHDMSIGPDLVRKFNIKMAIVTMPKMAEKKLAWLLTHSVSAFRYNVLIPSYLGITNIWMNIRDFSGILGLASSPRLKFRHNRVIKRFMDLSVTVAGGILLLPALLLIALIVKVSSKGPVLYASKRLLPDGKVFYAYKFRTMYTDAQAQLQKLLDTDPQKKQEWEENRKLKKDPRVTKFGAFLRKTSLDEFPQLINILKGEMSLVGPRPPLDTEELKKFGDDFDRIFSLRPGLTGLWQVSGRSDTDYAERVSMDTYYLQSWSVWLDLWVLYKTGGVVVMGKGAY